MTEPTTTQAELDQAIIDSSRELTAAIRSRPRDQQRIDDARTALNELLALRDSGA